MLKVIIVEDRIPNLKVLSALVNKHSELSLVGTAMDVNEGVKLIETTSPDLILLDIELPSGTGFDVLEQTKGFNYQVIFVTTHENYAIKAFQYSAIDYVLKPIKEDLFYGAVEKALANYKKDHHQLQIQTLLNNINHPHKKSEKIILNTMQDLHVIDIKSIIRCAAEDSYTRFYMNNGKKILSSKPLKSYEEILLEHNFFRTHKSFIMNMSHLDKFDKKNSIAILSDGSEVMVSVRKKDAFMEEIKRMF